MSRLMLQITPPILLDLIRSLMRIRYGWFGSYATWEEAKRDSAGYDQTEILEKVKTSLFQVKNGKAVYERDSVLFDTIQYSWPLLAGLMFASAKCKGAARVLDFGGSLGSTYYQNRRFLERIDEVSWNIVEQRHFVECGREHFEDEKLHFYEDIDRCVKEQNPNILILSSVLQYIERPYDLLEKLLTYNFAFILIDRTPFNPGNKDRIVVQKVPPMIYKASYPCWFFEENKLIGYFKRRGYSAVESFQSPTDGESAEYVFKGYIFQKGRGLSENS